MAEITAVQLLRGMHIMTVAVREDLEGRFGPRSTWPDDGLNAMLKGYEDMYEDAYNLWKGSLLEADTVEE